MIENSSLAIIGMACCLPGAKNIQEYWNLILEGRCAIGPIPAERYRHDLYFESDKDKCKHSDIRSYIQKVGVTEYPTFDRAKSCYPLSLSKDVDFLQLGLCQTVTAACRHANLDPFNLPLRRTGVYIGNRRGGNFSSDLAYAVLAEHAAYYLTKLDSFLDFPAEERNAILADVVHRIRRQFPSYAEGDVVRPRANLTATAISSAFGLDGPAMILDAACSSSLKALAIAGRELSLGNIEMAVVGSVSYVSLSCLLTFSAAQSASAGESRPFSELADGLVAAEGNTCVIVKTLERALSDGDPIQAVIHNIGVSSDGKGKSLWAPQSEGQYRAVCAAYPDPERIKNLVYLEGHMTSTPVGDQTEMQGLAKAFAGKFPAGEKCPIGGVKANTGHLLESAGMAGLLKAVLVMQHNTVPPQIGFEPLNPKVDWENFPFYVPRQAETLRPSPNGKPRMVGVNSFGIGGLNVHVSLEEALPRQAKSWFPSTAVAMTEQHREPIAIVGAGALFPGARTLEDFKDRIFSGTDPKTEVTDDRWRKQVGFRLVADAYHSRAAYGGFICDFEYNWRRHRIPPKQIATANPLQFMVLDCTDAALDDAGYDPKNYLPTRCGVIVGTTFDDTFSDHLSLGLRVPYFQDELKKVLECHGFIDADANETVCREYQTTLVKHEPAILDETGSFTSSSIASRITKTYNFQGGAGSIDAGTTGGMAGLKDAVNNLRMGGNDMMICAAGASAAGFPTFVEMSLSGEAPSSPEDVHSELDAGGGYRLPGEGAGTLILKRLSDAVRDGDRIHAVIRGVGCASVSQTNNKEKVKGAFDRAIHRAWDEVDGAEKVIQVAELSGGSKHVLEAELEALAENYSGAQGKPIPLGEVIPQFGYMFSASSMASLMKGMIELECQKVPANFAFYAPSETMKKFTDKLCVPTVETPLASAPNQKKIAAISSWDPAGFVYHVVLERYEGQTQNSAGEKAVTEETTAEETLVSRIIRVEAASAELLRKRLQEMQGKTGEGFRNSLEAFSDSHAGGSYRAAFVAGTEAEFAEQLRYALEVMDQPFAEKLLERKNIFLGEAHENPGKVAFLFSGQGSQYAGMLDGLTKCFGPVRDSLQEMDRKLRMAGMPTFEELTVSGGELLGSDVFRTQLSLLCADTLIFQGLRGMEIRPDVLSSHSYGEFPAYHAGGIWNFENAALATQIRCETILSCEDAAGAMLSTNLGGEEAQRVCAAFPGTAYPSNYNAPDQTVLGGTVESLEKILEILVRDGKTAKMIPVPRPFHTPLMTSTKPKLFAGLARVDFQRPALPLFSSVTNEYVADAMEARENLASQMTEPVRFVELIQDLARQGVTLFVECGPRRILTSLATKILGDSPVRCWAMDDSPQKDGTQFYRLRAWYEVHGYAQRPVDARVQMVPDVPVAGVKNAFEALVACRPAILKQLFDLADATDASVTRKTSAMNDDMRNLAKFLGVLPETVAAFLTREDAPTASAEKMIAWLSARFAAQEMTVDAGKYPIISRQDFMEMVNGELFPQKTWGRESRKYCRLAMRVMEYPLPVWDMAAGQAGGHSFIYGENDFSKALAGRLILAGEKVTVLPFTGNMAHDSAKAAQLCQDTLFTKIFLMAAYEDSVNDPVSLKSWEKQRQIPLCSFAVAQAWYNQASRHENPGEMRVCAATRLGGDFGYSGQITGLADGGLCGILKSIHMEMGVPTNFAFQAKIVDFSPGETPEGLAEKMLRSLACVNPLEMEIGWNGETSYAARAVPEKGKPYTGAVKPQGAWIVTGGGRGITAYVARKFAEKYGVKLHILGSSPAPAVNPAWRGLDEAGTKQLRETIMQNAKAEKKNPITEWKGVQRALGLDASLQEYAKAGVEAHYYCCDVSDPAQLAQAVEAIHKTGPISGILHGAGLEVSRGFAKKEMPTVEKTWEIKVDCLMHLLELTKNDPVTHVLGFGSEAGRLGGAGQSDYAMSNDALAKVLSAHAFRHPSCRASCFDWGPWDEIGMAVRPEMKLNPLLQKLVFLPPAEGADYVTEEMEIDYTTVEKLYVDWKHIAEHYYMRGKSLESMPEKSPVPARASEVPPQVSFPLVKKLLRVSPTEVVGEAVLMPETDPFLIDHRLRQRPLLPGVITLEMFCECVRQADPSQQITEMRDIQFKEGMVFWDNAPKPVRIRAIKTGPDQWECSLLADFYNTKGKLVLADRLYCCATLVVGKERKPSALYEVQVPQDLKWHPVAYQTAEEIVYHGPTLQQMKQYGCHEIFPGTEYWGELIILPQKDFVGGRGVAGWEIPSATLDACLYFCGVVLYVADRRFSLPKSIGQLTFGAMPREGSRCVVHGRLKESSEKVRIFQFTLFSENGEVLLTGDDYVKNILPQ